MARTYRVRVGLVLEYDVDAESAIAVRQHVAASRDALAEDLGGALWAGPDVVGLTVVDADAELVG